VETDASQLPASARSGGPLLHGIRAEALSWFPAHLAPWSRRRAVELNRASGPRTERHRASRVTERRTSPMTTPTRRHSSRPSSTARYSPGRSAAWARPVSSATFSSPPATPGTAIPGRPAHPAVRPRRHPPRPLPSATQGARAATQSMDQPVTADHRVTGGHSSQHLCRLMFHPVYGFGGGQHGVLCSPPQVPPFPIKPSAVEPTTMLK